MGSSIVKRAFTHARMASVDGVNLGLRKGEFNLWWQGKGGLRMKSTSGFIKNLLNYEEPPAALVLHVGGNDIGQLPLKQLRKDMLTLLNELYMLLPNTIFIWSQILPRLQWRNEISHRALEKCRVRLNSFAATKVLQEGGRYIRYPEIVEEDTGLFCDGVHLSHVGNDIFLYRIHQALQIFSKSSTSFVSPPLGEFGPWQLLM